MTVFRMRTVGRPGAIATRCDQMASGPEVAGDPAEGGREPPGRSAGAEALHGALAPPHGLMTVLGPVVQVLRTVVLDRRHDLAVGGTVAAEPVRDEHAG